MPLGCADRPIALFTFHIELHVVLVEQSGLLVHQWKTDNVVYHVARKREAKELGGGDNG